MAHNEIDYLVDPWQIVSIEVVSKLLSCELTALKRPLKSIPIGSRLL